MGDTFAWKDTMKSRTFASVSAPFLLLLLSFAFSQQPTLNLEFGGDVYLGHVSAGLEGLPSFRQHSATITRQPSQDGEVSEQMVEESRVYIAETGELSTRSRYDLMPGMSMISAQYLVDSKGYVIGGPSGQLSCQEVPAATISAAVLETTVADATGFKSATLVGEAEEVNGLVTYRYSLDRPPFAGRFEDGSLEGELWIARDGGFIVRYLVTGTDSSGITTIWRYDLTDVGSAQVAIPEECALQM